MKKNEMLRLAVIFTILAGPAVAKQEYILQTLFDVTGVASDDVLNIGQSPDADAEIVATLASDAVNIEVVQSETGWAQANAEERSGWASGRSFGLTANVILQGETPRILAGCCSVQP